MPTTAPPIAAITATAMRTNGSILSSRPIGARSEDVLPRNGSGGSAWTGTRCRLGDAPPGSRPGRVLRMALLGQRNVCLRLAYGRPAAGVKRLHAVIPAH